MASNKGGSFMADVKSGLKGIHSAGEALRGGFNETVDHTFNDKVGEAKNQAITDKGIQGVKATDEHFGTHHGVAANHATGNKVQTGGLTDTTVRSGETTGAGSHSGAPGNLSGSTAGGVVQGSRAGVQEDITTTQRY